MSEQAQPPQTRPEVAAVLGKLNELGSEFMTAQEWGIFAPTPPALQDQYEAEIIAAFETARREADLGHIAEAQSALLRAKSAFVRAQERFWWYRFNNQVGLLPVLLTVLSTILAFDLVSWWMTEFPKHSAPAHAALLGLMGASLKSLYWLQFQLGKGQLRPRWIAYFLVAPLIGVLLGFVSYLIVVVGSKLVNASQLTTPDALAVGLFAAFAGFNWEWALEKFSIVADSLASRVGVGKNANSAKRN